MHVELETILTRKQIQPTAMRLLVLEFLLEKANAVDLPALEKAFSYSDRTTLYRTLKTFEEKSLIHAINDGSGSMRYALCEDDCLDGVHTDLHLHFFCNECGETTCLPKTRIPDIQLPDQFKLEELNLIAKGVCSNCISAKECN